MDTQNGMPALENNDILKLVNIYILYKKTFTLKHVSISISSNNQKFEAPPKDYSLNNG